MRFPSFSRASPQAIRKRAIHEGGDSAIWVEAYANLAHGASDDARPTFCVLHEKSLYLHHRQAKSRASRIVSKHRTNGTAVYTKGWPIFGFSCRWPELPSGTREMAFSPGSKRPCKRRQPSSAHQTEPLFSSRGSV